MKLQNKSFPGQFVTFSTPYWSKLLNATIRQVICHLISKSNQSLQYMEYRSTIFSDIEF